MLCIEAISVDDSSYPKCLQATLGDQAPKFFYFIGDFSLLSKKTIGLFCSVKCPGKLILKTYDLARELRDKETPVISGFHSPMEKECLNILLRGKQPVIWCQPKRLIARSIPSEFRQAIEEGRLLILSPFGEKVRKTTVKTALFRNEIVALFADRVFISYAHPASKTESFCKMLINSGKTVETFDSPDTKNLLKLGCKVIS